MLTNAPHTTLVMNEISIDVSGGNLPEQLNYLLFFLFCALFV